MENFLCQECGNQLRINEGDYLFSYNIKCCNEHESKNIDLDNLLSKAKNCEILYKCKHGNKRSYIHCFECDEDICFGCYNKLHKQHKMDYLKNLNFDKAQKFNFEVRLKKNKININTFLTQINQFEKQFHTYINIFKSEIKKYYKFINKLIKNINGNNFTYIDIENVKKNIDTDYNKFINDNMEKLVHCNTFLKRYEQLKNIFDFIIKRGKYIEQQQLKDKIINNENKGIIPINNKYFIQNYNNSFKIIRTNFNCKIPVHDIIFEYNFDFNQIILKNIDNFENEFSFYLLKNKTKLNEVIIKNILNIKKNFNENIIIKNVKTFDEKINNFLILSPNKNIVFTKYKTYLYDDLFINQKLINQDNYYKLYDLLKLNENIFVYSTWESFDNYNGNSLSYLYIIKIVGDFIDKKTFKNGGYQISYYSEKEKILITHDIHYIYLFNPNISELIQKIKIDFKYKVINHKILMTNYNKFIKYFINFDKDNLYFEINEKIFREFFFYDITYLVQYRIIEKELIELSRIEINNDKILHYNKEEAY